MKLLKLLILFIFLGCAGHQPTREEAHRWCLNGGIDPARSNMRSVYYTGTYQDCMNWYGYEK